MARVSAEAAGAFGNSAVVDVASGLQPDAATMAPKVAINAIPNCGFMSGHSCAQSDERTIERKPGKFTGSSTGRRAVKVRGIAARARLRHAGAHGRQTFRAGLRAQP